MPRSSRGNPTALRRPSGSQAFEARGLIRCNGRACPADRPVGRRIRQPLQVSGEFLFGEPRQEVRVRRRVQLSNRFNGVTFWHHGSPSRMASRTPRRAWVLRLGVYRRRRSRCLSTIRRRKRRSTRVCEAQLAPPRRKHCLPAPKQDRTVSRCGSGSASRGRYCAIGCSDLCSDGTIFCWIHSAGC